MMSNVRTSFPNGQDGNSKKNWCKSFSRWFKFHISYYAWNQIIETVWHRYRFLNYHSYIRFSEWIQKWLIE